MGYRLLPIDLCICVAKQFDAAASGRCPMPAEQKKGHRLCKQLFNSQAMTACAWVERLKLRFKLRNQKDRIGGVGAFRRDDS